MCQGFVHTHAGLVVCRLLLGVFEAGVFPGTVQNNIIRSRFSSLTSNRQYILD